MKFNLLSDANWDSRVGQAVGELLTRESRIFFEERDYGAGLVGIVVVFMCRDPNIKFKRRIRFVRKTKAIYMDIMLDFNQMKPATDEFRRRVVAERLLDEVPAVLGKYSIPDFDRQRFIADLSDRIRTNG
jgi:hypothetical protein